ncbi:MAG: hypothetical protein WC107_05845 [Patescibacteria group bacterium]
MTVTVNELTIAYDLVSANTDKALTSGLAFELQKEAVETTTLQAIASGEIQGNNEGERKAAALAMFSSSYAILAEKELEYRQNSNALALAKIHLDFVRDCIRIEELAKK